MSQNPVNKDLDLITIGRSSVDLYGQQIGGRLEDMANARCGEFDNEIADLQLFRADHIPQSH